MLTQALDNEDFEILVDPRLENRYNRKEMFRMIEAAAACVRHSAAKRPRMSQVILFSTLNMFSVCCTVVSHSILDSFFRMPRSKIYGKPIFGMTILNFP